MPLLLDGQGILWAICICCTIFYPNKGFSSLSILIFSHGSERSLAGGVEFLESKRGSIQYVFYYWEHHASILSLYSREGERKRNLTNKKHDKLSLSCFLTGCWNSVIVTGVKIPQVKNETLHRVPKYLQPLYLAYIFIRVVMAEPPYIAWKKSTKTYMYFHI